jgi:hypothetical protein
VKKELAGLSFNKDTLNNNWEGVSRDIIADELAPPSGGGRSAAKSLFASATHMGRKQKKNWPFIFNRLDFIHTVRFESGLTSYVHKLIIDIVKSLCSNNSFKT